jgi:hypothetical protein
MQQKMASNKLGDVILSTEDGVGVDKKYGTPCIHAVDLLFSQN